MKDSSISIDTATQEPLEIERQLAVVLGELADRVQRGEEVDFEAVCCAHPEIAGELKKLWGTVLVTDAVGSSRARGRDDGPELDETAIWQQPLPAAFGDYELLEELGRGGMGIVYRARQAGLNREVAVKMILRHRLESLDDRRRFFAEAEATARLEHPGIVPVYEVGEFNSMPFFSMKLVRGQTLSARLAESPISQRESARLMIQVCQAVHFAHQNGILHRDVKPSNILIDEQGHVRLTDFGLAKRTGSQDSITRTGAVIGTPNYMSPEQASGGSVKLGPASDVYSIGTVLYQMLAGRPPLVANSPVELALKIMEQDPPPLRVLEPKIDRDLEMIVTRCLQKPPDLRYASAELLAQDLQAFLEHEPVEARSGRFGQIVARLLRETHHAPILENWGLLWMWHSMVLSIACIMTEVILWSGTKNLLAYAGLWTIGLGAWAAVFWALRRRMGPVTFIERQIAHVWGASMIGIGMLFPLEWWLQLEPLTLSPLLGIISGMVFLVKAGMLSGVFYFQAVCLFLTSIPMAVFPMYAHLIFGLVAAICFFIPGLKYYRQRQEADD